VFSGHTKSSSFAIIKIGNMKHNRNYIESEVIKSLNLKRDCNVDETTKTIRVVPKNNHNKAHDLGNKSWGKIGFLLHYRGYSLCQEMRPERINNEFSKRIAKRVSVA
jgi:hypothetical protein